MSLTLYAPKSHINAGSKVELAARFLGVDLEFNRIPPTEWKSAEYLQKHPLGKIPTLETPEGCIYESMTIIRYLARRAGKLYGSNAAETAQIDQWFEFTNTQIWTVIRPLYVANFGYAPITKQEYEHARKTIVEVLKTVDAHLEGKEFLAINQFTLADVVVAAGLRYAFTLIFDEATRAQIPNLTKWFVKTMEHPTNVEYFGKTWLCQKESTPDFEFLKTRQQAPPKKEEKKKEQQPKKAEKKAEKKEEEEDEIPEMKEEKKVNPLDILPKSTFVLDDFKRDFVNAENKQEALGRFWAAYDPEGYSLWKLDYELYEGEGKVGYLTCNLKNGFIRNIDHFRKYTFAVLGVYGDDGDYVINGVWLWRGTEIPEEWKEHNSYEYFKFKKLDHTNEEDRKMVEEYWLNTDEGVVQGRPVFEAKWFK